MVVTIDGPAGSGKSTIAQLLAEKLGAAFLDTGAMYRAVTLAAMRGGVDLDDQDALQEVLRSKEFDFTITGSQTEVKVDGEDFTEDIRLPEVTVNVKHIASAPALRSELVAMQRKIAAGYERIVTEGRDQGTVAFPDAEYKFFLIADVAERAHRRHLQLKENGTELAIEAIEEQIRNRDASDESRTVGPLTCAEDAITIDTTGLSIEQVIEKILTYIK